MTTALPPTYLPGWHDLELVQQMQYTRLGDTDLSLSKFGFGGCVVGGVYPDKGDLEEIFEVGRNFRGIFYFFLCLCPNPGPSSLFCPLPLQTAVSKDQDIKI